MIPSQSKIKVSTESIISSAFCKGFADARVSKVEDERLSILSKLVIILLFRVFEYRDSLLYWPRNLGVIVCGLKRQVVAETETETTEAATLLNMFSYINDQVKCVLFCFSVLLRVKVGFIYPRSSGSYHQLHPVAYEHLNNTIP